MKTLYCAFCTLATGAFFALAVYSYGQIGHGYTKQERDALSRLIDRETMPLGERQAAAMVYLYGGNY